MSGAVSRRRRLADGAVVALAALVVVGPALFTRDGFMVDFTNHLWLVWVQQTAISHHLLPTYFTSATPVGLFYPVFEFYGGTLYAVTGVLAVLLGGHVTAAYVATMLLAVAAAYGGLLWLARQLGARSWPAHAPAIAFVASAYYVSNLYGRGAWPEFIATSTIPLLLSSGLRLARSPRVEVAPSALFVLASIVFVGSHNATLLLACVVLLVSGALLWWALEIPLSEIRARRLALTAGLFALAVGVNAWFLLPDLVHASDVQITSQPVYSWKTTGIFNTPGILFDPLRSVPSGSSSPGLFVQAPDWLLLWALGAATFWSAAGRRLRRCAAVLGICLLGLLAFVMVPPLWNALPHTLREVQFPYRLSTYVALAVAALVLVGVLAMQRERPGVARRRLMARTLGGAIAVSVALCVWQLWEARTDVSTSYRNRSGVFASTHAAPRTWYDASYTDASAPVIHTGDRGLYIPPAAITADHASMWVTPPAGRAPFATDIAGGPYAVRISGGIEAVGRMPNGLVVARRRANGNGPVYVSFALAGGAITTGRIVSLVSIAGLALLLCGLVGRRHAVRLRFGRRLAHSK